MSWLFAYRTITPVTNFNRNEDLQKYNQEDQSQSTVTQIPATPDAEGSAAGGSGESDSTLKGDTNEKPTPDLLDQMEKKFAEPYEMDAAGKTPTNPWRNTTGTLTAIDDEVRTLPSRFMPAFL
jgi:hypothetical protein